MAALPEPAAGAEAQKAAERGHQPLFYKDPGGPAQLGTRDWAGLKGHGADRDLARYGGQKRAAPGEGISHVRRHRAPKGRSWVGYNSV